MNNVDGQMKPRVPSSMPEFVPERAARPTEVDAFAHECLDSRGWCPGAKTHDVDIRGRKILGQVHDVPPDPAGDGLEELADVQSRLHVRLR